MCIITAYLCCMKLNDIHIATVQEFCLTYLEKWQTNQIGGGDDDS